MYAKKNSGLKVTATLLAIVLLIGCAVGGTIAWLMDSTKEVTNTFTVGNIQIDLTETVGTENKSAKDYAVSNETFKIIPGKSEKKDPTVTVKAGSEACYVFVKIQDNTTINGVKYVEWSVAEGWSPLDATNYPGVYYRTYDETTEAKYDVLKDNKVSYPGALTKADLEAVDGIVTGTGTETKPSLVFTAYAVQKANGDSEFNVNQAWDIAQDGVLTATP